MFSIFLFLFFFFPVHRRAIITDSWIQMKGNSSFNFLCCSCPVLKSSAIPSDEFSLWERYQLCANLMEVSAKRFKRSHLLFLKVRQPLPFCSTSSLLSLLQKTREIHRVCETRGEFTTVADRCTLRYRYSILKERIPILHSGILPSRETAHFYG